MYKNLNVLNFPNERDALILETEGINEHWSAVLEIKEGEKLYKYCSGSFNMTECNYPMMEKEILAVIREIDCKGIVSFVKKNLSNIQAQVRLLRCQL